MLQRASVVGLGTGGERASIHAPIVSLSGSLALWLSSSLALWLSGSLALWLSGSLALWLSGSLATPYGVWRCTTTREHHRQ